MIIPILFSDVHMVNEGTKMHNPQHYNFTYTAIT